MTGTLSARRGGARISASVKWYDPAKGYGFLEPHDGSPDIFCRQPALGAVGLDTLIAGAAIDCETVAGSRGPEVSRICAVDFSTAAPRPQPVNVSRSGRPAPPVPPGPGRRVRALVKWFMPLKGYGFLEPEDGSPDVFCHLGVVEASGRDTLPQGAVVTCETVQGDRGPQVSRIVSVEAPATRPGPAERSQPLDSGYPGPHPGAATSAVRDLPATVKFYDPARGFGFVVPDAGGREVFVHSSVLFRSGMTDLEPGQRVTVRAESVPRGLQATEISPI